MTDDQIILASRAIDAISLIGLAFGLPIFLAYAFCN